MTSNKKTFAVIYARVSARPNEDDSQSIEHQIQRCQSYCKRYKYEYSDERTFSDVEISGASDLDERDGLFGAIEGLRKNNVLVVDRIDRLARSILYQQLFEVKISMKGAKIEYVAGYNEQTPEGKMIRGILSVFAEYQRVVNNQRTSIMMKRHQKNGKRMGRVDKLPFGIMIDPTDPDKVRTVKDPDQAIMLKYIRELWESGLSYRKISKELKECGRWPEEKVPRCHATIRTIAKREGWLDL